MSLCPPQHSLCHNLLQVDQTALPRWLNTLNLPLFCILLEQKAKERINDKGGSDRRRQFRSRKNHHVEFSGGIYELEGLLFSFGGVRKPTLQALPLDPTPTGRFHSRFAPCATDRHEEARSRAPAARSV